MKTILTLLFLSAVLSAQDNPKEYKYFMIDAQVNHSPLFYQVLEDFAVEDDPHYNQRFTIVINISSNKPNEQYIVLGMYEQAVELDPNSSRISWGMLRKQVRDGLINWTGKNKINLGR